MAHRLRIVALDHFFGQDLDALEQHPRLSVRRIPYTRLRDRAIAILGDDVGTGLERFVDDALAGGRERYARWLAREVEALYLEWPFDVFVLPSDVFFYVRDLPEACHRLGVPVAVVQKETTISRATMELHAPVVGQYAPFVSDVMTVCSERHAQFWLRSGADPKALHVTGQPRFDLYAAARRSPPKRPTPRVLFLSYELDAYEPGAGQGRGGTTWQSLRDATERALQGLVADGQATVVVKHHPQQEMRSEIERLRSLAGPSWRRGWEVAEPLDDTRRLIVDADVVVGFQTTALYESVAAGRPAIYAAWGEAFDGLRDGLIRFDLEEPCIRHATSPGDLRRAVLEASPPLRSCDETYREALGPVDGHATERTLAVLESIAADWTPTDRASELARREVRVRHARGQLLRALVEEVGLAAARPVAARLGRHRGVDLRLAGARDRRRRLQQIVTGR